MAKVKEEKGTLDTMLEALEKKYGVNRVLIDYNKIVSTGSLQLNKAMGTGGTALGKMVEIFGPESSGKSTLVLHQIVEYQRAFPNKKTAYFDYENSFDKKYAINVGVDVDNLLIYQPETQEDGYDMILALIEKDITSCIVIDSQTAAVPKVILQGDMGDATIGLQARINSKFCMKIKGLLTIHDCTLFLISQLRDNIGGMGDPITTTGGKAFKFYADVRWKVWKMNDKRNELNKTTVDVVKNKLAPPFGQAKFNILWGKGIDTMGEILDYAIEFDIVKQAGSWLSYKDIKIQGMVNLQTYLEEHYEILLEIEKRVLAKLANVEEIEVVESITVTA